MEKAKMTKVKSNRLTNHDRIEYRALYALTFLPCLALVTWNRLFPSRANRSAAPSNSVIAEANSATHAAVGYAFMV